MDRGKNKWLLNEEINKEISDKENRCHINILKYKHEILILVIIKENFFQISRIFHISDRPRLKNW